MYLFKQTSVVILFFCLSLGCKKDPVAPESNKNPREYTWQADTLAYPGSFQTSMSDIWGSTSKNLYVVGHNDQNRGLMWHFNGNKWSDVKLIITQGGAISGAIDLAAIYGFGPNDIWAVGTRLRHNPNPPPNFIDSSLVIRFDGSQWRENKVSGGSFLQTVWGSSPNDVWVAGLDNTLFYFDGAKWRKDIVPISPPARVFHIIRSIAGRSADEVYMLVHTDDSALRQEKNYFLRLQAGRWAIVDSAVVRSDLIENKWGDLALWYSPWNVLYSVGDGGIFDWTGTTWHRKLISPSPFTAIAGTNPNNILAVGIRGNVWHYDGLWAPLKNLAYTDLTYTGVWTDGKEAFIIGSTGNVTVVLHGK